MRFPITVVVALLLSSLAAPAAARQDKVRIFITSRTQSNNPRSNIGTAAAALESAVGSALMRKYKCASTLRQSEALALIDQERKRQLLGGEGGDEALAAIGNAVGAEYIASFTLVETGGQLSVNGAMLDNHTVKATTRESTSMAVDEEALGQLESFASTFADSFSGPVCPGDWMGTFTLKRDAQGQDPSLLSTHSVSFQVRGEGDQRVTVQYAAHEKSTSSPNSKGQTITVEKSAAGSHPQTVWLRTHENTLQLRVPAAITLEGTVSQPANAAGMPWKWDVYIDALDIPIPPKAETLSGSRTGIFGKLEWNLYRAKTASAR